MVHYPRIPFRLRTQIMQHVKNDRPLFDDDPKPAKPKGPKRPKLTFDASTLDLSLGDTDFKTTQPQFSKNNAN